MLRPQLMARRALLPRKAVDCKYLIYNLDRDEFKDRVESQRQIRQYLNDIFAVAGAEE